MTSPTPSPISQAAGEPIADAAKALAAKLRLIEADPAYTGIWGYLNAHGYKYTGPSYAAELFALEVALSTAPTTGSAPESVIRGALNVAYGEGWDASGEGYNAEYPGKNFNSENWEARRNLAIDHLVNRIAASMGGDKS